MAHPVCSFLVLPTAAGPGILASARTLGLEFAPVTRERYDLVIPEAFLGDDEMRFLLGIARPWNFKAKADEPGGYETGETGKGQVSTAGGA